MSKPKDDDLLKNQNDPDPNSPGGSNSPDGNNSGSDPAKGQKRDEEKKDKQNFLTIEEHRKNLKVDAPVFAAVMQAQGWSAGKKVPLAIFEVAVKTFLGAPIGGITSEGGA